MTSVELPARIRFERWEIRPYERALLVAGRPVKLGGRAFDVLMALVQRQGRVASKSELLDAAWPGLVVEENNLSVQITTLRKLLGADAIVTVAGFGYQLAGLGEPGSDDPLSAASKGGADIRSPSPQLRPAPPALVGRDSDLAAVIELVQRSPLVSVVGTGGVGKTSLARQAMACLAPGWRDGVHWIDLAPLSARAQLLAHVAKALGSFGQALDDLAAALAREETLIVLDNCEHLQADVAELVSAMLERAPGVRWLATSLEPLHLADEAVYRLEPLSLPVVDAGPAQALASSSVALFVERARSADRHFELAEGNVQAVVDVCRGLDGLPLAIEMAAARVAAIGLTGMQAQLDQRLRLRAVPRDVPARQQTLWHTYEWSYGLLSGVEQRVFRRLHPFCSGFTPRPMLQLCCGFDGDAEPLQEWQVLDALGALVDRSLVQRRLGSMERFTLLESARDFTRAKLVETAEFESAMRRHAAAVAAQFAAAQGDHDRLRDDEWSPRYLPEWHNVRSALSWACTAADADLLARLVTALAQLDTRAQAPAAVLQCQVPIPLLLQARPELRSRACLELGWAHYLDGNREQGTALVSRALEDFDADGDVIGCYRSLAALIRLYEGRPGSLDRAQALAQRLGQLDDRQVPLLTRLTCTIAAGFQHGSRTIGRLQELHDLSVRSGFEMLAAICRTHITDQLLIEGRFDEALAAARAMLGEGDAWPRARGMTLQNLALACVRLGRDDEARSAARDAIRALPSAAHMIADLFAYRAAQRGRSTDAALLAGYGERVKRDRDWRSDPAEASLIADTLARLQAQLEPERLGELMRLGAAMSAAEALAMALAG